MKNKYKRKKEVAVFPSSIQDVYASVAPYVPTPLIVVRRMLELAKVKQNETLIDLGSGDGRVVLIAAKEFGAKGVGVELIGKLVNKAKRKALAMGLVGVDFIRGDFFDVDLSSADVVTMYLMKGVTDRVRVKLEGMLKSGTRVVTLDYPITKWSPDDVLEIDDVVPKHTIYLYVWRPAST